MIQFATKHTIIQPKNKVPLVKRKKDTDHFIGGNGIFTGPTWESLTNGHWLQFVPPSSELQRNIYGDTYGCEGFSLNSAHRFIWKRRYAEDLNKCDRFLVVGSGTIPGKGNGTENVAEWDRLNGWILESRWPFTPDMTITTYFNGGKVPPEMLAEGKENLKTTEIGYKWLKDELPNTKKVGLTFSPVRTSVKSYAFDATGTRIIDSGGDYVHEIIIFDFVDLVEWWAWDSENSQYVKFAWDYPFDGSMIHTIKKKVMTKIYKQKGQPALYALDPLSQQLVPFVDGSVAGGEVFRTLYGVNSYSDIPRVKDSNGEDWDILPFPVAHWSITSASFIK